MAVTRTWVTCRRYTQQQPPSHFPSTTPQQPQAEKPSDLGTLMSTTYPHHLYSHLHHPQQKMLKNKVPSIASWTITLVQSKPPPNHHYHLQWSSIDLSLYLMCLHPLLKLHPQCSILAIIIAPQMRHLLSQPSRSPLITRPSGARKHSTNQFNI